MMKVKEEVGVNDKEMRMKWKDTVGGFVRRLVMAVRYGSWQLAKEVDGERELFPKAYAMRKKGELEKGAER